MSKDNTPTNSELREHIDAIFKSVWARAVVASTKRDEEYLALKDSTIADTTEGVLKLFDGQIQEQLKALLPDKRKTVKDTRGSIGMGWLLSEAEPFNQAIDQIEKAIEEWTR